MHARLLPLRARAGRPVLAAANDNQPPMGRTSLTRRAIARVEREPTAFALYLLMLGLLSAVGYVALSVILLGVAR